MSYLVWKLEDKVCQDEAFYVKKGVVDVASLKILYCKNFIMLKKSVCAFLSGLRKNN